MPHAVHYIYVHYVINNTVILGFKDVWSKLCTKIDTSFLQALFFALFLPVSVAVFIGPLLPHSSVYLFM